DFIQFSNIIQIRNLYLFYSGCTPAYQGYYGNQSSLQGPRNNQQHHQLHKGQHLDQTGDMFVQDSSEYKCCDIEFPSKACFDSHTMVVHNGYCEICKSRLDSETDILRHGLKHKGVKPFQCKHCYRVFQSATGLQLHMTKDVLCIMCDKVVSFSHRSKHARQHFSNKL
ncbi:unnamed protein product, partial [Owenia fusiformis]